MDAQSGHGPPTQHPELLREEILTARARRRLVEFELTERRIILCLVVVNTLATAALLAMGHQVVAGGTAGCGLAMGIFGTLRRTQGSVAPTCAQIGTRAQSGAAWLKEP